MRVAIVDLPRRVNNNYHLTLACSSYYLGVSPRRLDPQELFHASTWDMDG